MYDRFPVPAAHIAEAAVRRILPVGKIANRDARRPERVGYV